MEQIQQTVDQIQQMMVHLTSVVNRQVEQIATIENRINYLEIGNTPIENSRSSTVHPLTEADLATISRLPDCVKELQVFDGNPIQYVSWVHSVESILEDYEVVRHKPIYSAIIKHIRQKVRGEADNALISYNIFNEQWSEIKKCLSLHYADKRDIQSLENQLVSMQQGRSSISEFYGRVNHQLSLIINKIKTDDYSEEGKNVLVGNYRHRALDVFIRGLQQNLSQLVKVQRPLNLPEAYAACLELQNMDFRKSMSYSESENRNMCKNNYDNNSAFYRKNFIPPINNHNQVTQTKPIPNPKPPIPMEVDSSIQTAKVDYINRPRVETRQSNESSQIPSKQQRIFNIVTKSTDEQEKEYLSNYEGYFDEVNDMNFTDTNDRTEINTLETVHPAETNSNNLISHRNLPVNDFKDKLVFLKGAEKLCLEELQPNYKKKKKIHKCHVKKKLIGLQNGEG